MGGSQARSSTRPVFRTEHQKRSQSQPTLLQEPQTSIIRSSCRTERQNGLLEIVMAKKTFKNLMQVPWTACFGYCHAKSTGLSRIKSSKSLIRGTFLSINSAWPQILVERSDRFYSRPPPLSVNRNSGQGVRTRRKRRCGRPSWRAASPSGAHRAPPYPTLP